MILVSIMNISLDLSKKGSENDIKNIRHAPKDLKMVNTE